MLRPIRLCLSALVALGSFAPISAQLQTLAAQPSGEPRMPVAQSLVQNALEHVSSGTSIEPASTPMPMLMSSRDGWQLMLHGIAFVSAIQQHAASGRGGDKLFSTNSIMPMAQHPIGSRGILTLRTMLSLEPATITGRFYPELFQQGETAYGSPIVDGQHPHDFLMELAALYDLRLGEHTLLSFYTAPVGDPAIGPTAYPHRASAAQDPIAALGHHQQDSTHIAFNVLTAGLTWHTLRLEASGFHGAEPTEARWHFQPSPNGHAPDSESSRLTWSPTSNLAAQYSIAHITSPEALSPITNQRRQTASLAWNRPLGAHHDTASMPGMDMSSTATANLATTLLWGQTKSTPGALLEDSYLAEALLTTRRNALWTRIEIAARTSELLRPAPPVETSAGHVQAYSLGYGRTWQAGPTRLTPSVQFTAYHAPISLAPTYGRVPFGAVVSLRIQLGQ